MTKNTETQLQTPKSLSALIASETKDPLYAIRSACDTIRDNLDEAMKFVDLIAFSSSRGLVFADMILKNINDEEIDRSSFEELSIRDVVENAIAQYLFNGRDEIELLNVNYDDDFVFKGDEVLMSFVILNLLKNSLVHKARIDVWFDAKNRCVYWRDAGVIAADKLKDIFSEQRSDLQNPTSINTSSALGLPFCKRVMKAFCGDIFVKSEPKKGMEFCLQF